MIDIKSLSSFVLPVWVKPVAIALVLLTIWGHGYVHGLQKASTEAVKETVKIIYKQNKITDKVVKEGSKKHQKLVEKGNDLKEKGNSYAIKFPNDKYEFNNYFVWLYDSSVLDTVPPLSEGAASKNSGVEVSEALPIIIDNNTIGKQWQQRALQCEQWTEEQEKASVK